jgi:hypothetical protein
MMKANRIGLTLGFLLLGGMTLALQGQQRAGGGAPGARPAPQPIPLFFKEAWKDIPGNVAVTQEHISNPDLELKVYGKDVNLTAEGNLPHIWTGLCSPSCGLALRHKSSFVDLTGKAKIRWVAKTSGFHQIRPIVKLADGTWLVGDYADAYTFDFHQVEFYTNDVKWMKIDMETRQPKGVLLDKVDLSKVDEVGFVDLTPGSGHGNGGYSDMGWIEVYGKPVPRS